MILHFKTSTLANMALPALALTFVAAISPALLAATLCVNPGGTGGCYAKINTAVSAASPNDTIEVAAGTYKEDVIIGKPLSLVGANNSTTVIDAKGLSNGIFVDGLDHSGLSDVVVSGFKVQNANFEGILVTNASGITIWNNWVLNNDASLNVSAVSCPGQPPFETAEGFDCGEGIHLIGVDHSIVSNNTVMNNSGGILLSDETGSTHDNLIFNNVVKDNPFDCGITMASHPPASLTSSKKPFGIFHNTILLNRSTHNGTAVAGAGAGIGIFTPVPGGTVAANVVVNNIVLNNGLPGIAFHAHGKGQNLDDNMIAGNRIAGNGADTDDAATPGPTGINVFGVSPIKGTVIAANVITDEAEDLVTHTPASVQVHLNDFFETLGVDNIGSGTVDATENWWGCAGGPGTDDCASAGGPGILFYALAKTAL